MDKAQVAKKKRSLSVSKTKQDAVQSGSSTGAAKQESTTLHGGDEAVANSDAQQQSIFLPSQLNSQNCSETKAQSPGDTPSSQSRRSKRPVQRFGLSEVDTFDTELELALKLSAAEAQINPTLNSPSREHHPQSDSTSADAIAQAARPGALPPPLPPLACDFSADCAAGDGSAAAKVLATPAAKVKHAATLAVVKNDAISARDTKKKRSRVLDSEDEEMLSPAKHVLTSLQGVASKEGSKPTRKHIAIDDSEGEEATAPCKAVKQGQLSPKPVHSPSKGGEHTGVENHSASERTQRAIENESSHIESDSIPDSEDEGTESVERVVEAKKKQAKKMETAPQKAPSKKRALQQENLSEDEKAVCPKQQGLSDQCDPLAKEIPSAVVNSEAKVALGKTKNNSESSDDEDEPEEELSEPEESDDDFESEEDDDFKGKEFKGKNNKQATKKLKPEPKKPAAMDTAPLSRRRQAPQPIAMDPSSDEQKSGYKKSRAEKELAALQFSNPGVKAAVVAVKKSCVLPPPPPLKPQLSIPAAAAAPHNTAPVTGGAGTELGSHQSLPQKVVGGESAPAKSKTKHGKDVAPSTWTNLSASATARPATAAAAGVGEGSGTTNRVTPSAQPPPQSAARGVGGAGGGCGGGPTLASKPPRVGLGKHMRSSTPLHRPAASGSAAPAAGGARQGGQGVGVKIVGGQSGVRRPGLPKNVVVRQQLHQRAEF